MEQTKYVANDKAWKLYDPLYTQYRSLYQRDVQKVLITAIFKIAEFLTQNSCPQFNWLQRGLPAGKINEFI